MPSSEQGSQQNTRQVKAPRLTTQEQISISIFLYLVLFLVLFLLPGLGFRGPLILLALAIKDVLLFMDPLQEIETESLQIDRIQAELKAKKQTVRYYLSVLNRVYVFPLILTGYLLYLLIDQTQLRSLQESVFYRSLSEQILLIATILSGIFLVYKEEMDEQYIQKKTSKNRAYLSLVLSIFLGGLATYIIYTQTSISVGSLSIVLSFVAGFLVFLVGLLLLEQDEILDPGGENLGPA